jgi:PPOX class probable F420-dependent enzyme
VKNIRPSATRSEPAIPDAERHFLAEMKVPGILATIGRSGGPVTSAVWYGIDRDEVVISTPAGRTKANNIAANSRVSFIVDSRDRPYSGVAIEGIARLCEDPGGEAWLAIARRYLGNPLPDDIVRRYHERPRVLVRITPRRVRSWNLAPVINE